MGRGTGDATGGVCVRVCVTPRRTWTSPAQGEEIIIIGTLNTVRESEEQSLVMLVICDTSFPLLSNGNICKIAE